MADLVKISKIKTSAGEHEIDAKYWGGKTIDVLNDLNNMEEIAYSDLNNLKIGSKLIKGKQYRITDYVTTTTQANTQSAGHSFDIIVTADSNNTFNEVARACLHSGDTYFNGVNMDAWEIKYSFDNDTNRFAWASSSGKGVIYYMKDEFNNECPYDFKNIMFVNVYNEYTFSEMLNNGGTTDITVVNSNGNVCNNIILPSYDNSSGSMILSGNVFMLNTNAEFCQFNYIGYNSKFNHFGRDCYSNTLGDNCYSNTLGDNCNSNTFGDNCYSNRFGSDCKSNTFGNGCYSNTLGDNCNSNTFGDNCYSNRFVNGCKSNTFGNECYSNTFSGVCNSNTFGNECYSNTFGNGCSSNTFGNGCTSNSFGKYCFGNSFGNDCQYNGFYVGASYTNQGNSGYIVNSEKLNYVRNITISEGCAHLLVYTNQTTNSSNYVQNITITKGVKSISSGGRISPLAILISDVNNEYEIKVARNINGDIKMYCEADLIR